MKLRKQTPAKALIAAACAGLLALFYGVVRAEPRAAPEGPATTSPAVDYRDFFAPAPGGPPSTPAAPPRPITRTRAS